MLGAGMLAAAAWPAAAGDIQGSVAREEKRPRRRAGRYPGRGGEAPAELQTVPALALVAGAIEGSPVAPPEVRPRLAQRDTLFDPPLLVIPVGTTVDFPNEDAFFHNVFSYSKAARFDLGRYPMGESKEVTFSEAGTIKVYCEVHKTMRAAIHVVENPFHAQVDAEGGFTIKGVPAGRRLVRVWDMDAEAPAETEVEVPAEGEVRVELKLAQAGPRGDGGGERLAAGGCCGEGAAR
ncbi:MAG: hypothetical protein HY722_00985 [Planctomycetes bacterium]|nr:hypothetical protein [Planctomycetota bacterium]